MQKRLAVILYFLLLSTSNADSDTSYYTTLIAAETAKALIYPLPTSNKEFRSGYKSQSTEDAGNYDWIIVGAGSAGCVLATRLSEIFDWKILLLEAGDEETDFTQIPAMWLHTEFGPTNWGYYSTPQKKSCQAMIDKKCIVPRGKSLGGSSAINAMMYVRGNRLDFDNWVTFGNPGWFYEDCLPYFRKSENSQIYGDAGYHGKDGLWNVEYSVPPSPYLDNFFNGTEELNFTVLDYNGRSQIGSSQVQFNIKHGKRQSTNAAFLDMARRRNNLKVITNTLVTKILIDRQTNTATGVEFVTKDKKYKVTATKEVIISAGAINTPQLLILSGIGPKEHLESLGIEVVVDSPVGQNLLEHPLFIGFGYRTNATPSNDNIFDNVNLYLDGMGPLTRPTNIEGIFYIHTDSGNPEVPTTEAIFVPPGGVDLTMLARATNFNPIVLASFLVNFNPKTDGLILLTLLHEKSRGKVTLKSANPLDFPDIDLNMLDEEQDEDDLADGIEVLLKLLETDAFKRLKASPLSLLDFPICQGDPKSSRTFWKCMIRQMTATIYNPSGSAPMGSNKTFSVVDQNLKVYGVNHLRVIDASVFPTTTSGHTNAPTVMAAEKASDQIKGEYERL